MTRILHPEWRAEQLSGNYPFSDQATLINADGRSISPDTFLDAHLYVIGAGPLYLSKIEIENGEVTLHVGDVANVSLATATFPAASPPELLVLEDSYRRSAGVLIPDPQKLAAIAVWSDGIHIFTYEETSFAAACCLTMPQIGVRAIRLEDGTMFRNNVLLVGSNGIVLRVEDNEGVQKCGVQLEVFPTIRVDIVGDPLFVRKLCKELEFTAPRPARKLRVHNRGQTYEITPDEHGNVSITTGDALASRPALRLRNQPEGLVFEVLGTAIE